MKGNKRDWRAVMPHYRLFDDALMMACFDDVTTVQEVLRIILGRPFTVTKVKVQEKVPPSQWHGAVFDVTALDEKGNKCDIEIQKEDTGNLVKRAEFYSCVLGRMALDTGEDYDSLRETYVIFITETDVFGHGIPVYHVERHIVETGEPFNGGQHILFVNGDYTGNDEVGQLVHDMKQTSADDINNKILADRVRIFKETVKEDSKMSELTRQVFDMGREDGIEEGMEKGVEKGVEKGKRETARAMLARHLNVNMIAECTGLSLDEVKALQTETATA